MKQILLSQGKVALLDDEDYERLNQFKWYACGHGRTFYAQRNEVINGKRTIVRMHRAIMDTPAGMEVDHRDGDGLNNQRVNLRCCAHQQNNWNRGAVPNSSSKFKGVTWDKSQEKWVAQIKRNGKRNYLGMYSSEEEAARAFDKASLLLDGEFARLNFAQDEGAIDE